jgi:hypothetical protein
MNRTRLHRFVVYLRESEVSPAQTRLNNEILSAAGAYLHARAAHIRLRQSGSPSDQIESADSHRTRAHNRYIDTLRISCRAAVQSTGEPLPDEFLSLIGEHRDRAYRQHIAEAALVWALAQLQETPDDPRLVDLCELLSDLPGTLGQRLEAARGWIEAG